MRFGLIDRVVEVEPGRRIVAVKAVSLSEEYLSEHFPTFPVLPGVFMLECMVEAARWCVYTAEDFAHSLILLQSTRGITYKSFVVPGQVLRVEVMCRRITEEGSEFSGSGVCEGLQVVKGRFALVHQNLTARSMEWAETDRRIIQQARERWSLLQ